MSEEVTLREVRDSDLPIFFEQQRDSEAVFMAAFTAKDPEDRAAFDSHWARIRTTKSIVIRTILHRGDVAGHVLSFVHDERREISYWLGREFWGKGIGTSALALYVDEIEERPLFARVAADNAASRRVLEKCGFVLVEYGRGFANARGRVIEELVMRLVGEKKAVLPFEQVLARHTASMGGAPVIEAVTGIEIRFHLWEPAFEVNGVYRATRRGQMRVDIFAGEERVFSEGYDGEQAWQMAQGAEYGVPASEQGAAALKHGIENQLFGLHELSGRGHGVTPEAMERIEETNYHVVRVDYADGHVQWRFLNPETWRVDYLREHRALHPDVDSTETTIETRVTDYRPVGPGLIRPFREVQIDLSDGRELQRTDVVEIAVNPDLDPGLFACP